MIVGSCAAPAAGIRPWPTGAQTAAPRLSRKSIPWRDSPGAPCRKLDLGLGTIVDDSVTGILKPDPRAYAADIAALGAQACDLVFVNDLPRNVAGARAFGMVGIDLDLLRPRVAFERARVALGLDEAGIPAADPEQRLARGLRGSSWWPRDGHRSPLPDAARDDQRRAAHHARPEHLWRYPMTATGETRAAATATAPASPLDVDALDVDVLERSFDLVAPHGLQLVEHFYDLLFERAPDLRAMFPDLERQRTSLLATLVVLRRSLRDLPALAPTLRKLGARHVSYGARPEHYPIVAELLIRAMRETAGPRWSALDTAQWEKALQLVAVEMLAGAASTAQPAGAPGSAAGA